MARALAHGAGGPGGKDAELLADLGDDSGDGAVVLGGEAVLGGTMREKLGLERDGTAQDAGDAGEDLGAVGGAEVVGEEVVVWGVDAATEGGGEPVDAGDEPVNEEEEDEPAGDVEQTH